MSVTLEERVAQLEAKLEQVAQLEVELRLARDKQQIYDSLMLYCRGIDRCVPELVHRVWPAQDLETCNAITDWLSANTKVTEHFIGNCLIDVDGDEAQSEAYLFSYHVYDVDGKEKLRVKAMRDFRTWKRTDDGWVATKRTGRDDWNWFVELEERAPGAEAWTYGERGTGDIAFHIRETMNTEGYDGNGAALQPAGYPGLRAWK